MDSDRQEVKSTDQLQSSTSSNDEEEEEETSENVSGEEQQSRIEQFKVGSPD